MARDPALSATELQSFLAEHPGWSLSAAGELERAFTFPKFLAGISFVQRVAAAAEEQNHHPDLDIRYATVTVRLITHDASALTARDLRLAMTCERVATP